MGRVAYLDFEKRMRKERKEEVGQASRGGGGEGQQKHKKSAMHLLTPSLTPPRAFSVSKSFALRVRLGGPQPNIQILTLLQSC